MGYGNCGGERTLGPNGNENHCCYLQGEICPMLVDWDGTIACSLMLLSDGDWDAVEADPRYQAWIAPHWEAIGDGPDACRTFPVAGDTCGACGASSPDAIGTPVAIAQNQKRALERDVLTPQLEAWQASHGG
jgi:hypothetical protein